MILENKKLLKLLEEKEELITEGRKLTAEIEKVEKERAKIGLQIQKIKDKVIPMMTELKPTICKEEFDDIESVSIVNGKIEVKTFNHLEEFKKQYREKVSKKD